MIALPRLFPRSKERHNLREVGTREYRMHRRFVRQGKYSTCIVPGCNIRPLQFCHIRSGLPKGYQAGVGQKPHDLFGFGACHEHHREQHNIGEASFANRYGINLIATALAYGLKSPVREIRELAEKMRSEL